jgi:hypothetical protein
LRTRNLKTASLSLRTRSLMILNFDSSSMNFRLKSFCSTSFRWTS